MYAQNYNRYFKSFCNEILHSNWQILIVLQDSSSDLNIAYVLQYIIINVNVTNPLTINILWPPQWLLNATKQPDSANGEGNEQLFVFKGRLHSV